MDYQGRWQKLASLGKGGQGEVFSVVRVHEMPRSDRELLEPFTELLRALSSNTLPPTPKRLETFAKFRAILPSVLDLPRDNVPEGALKVLHKPEDARDPERAAERIRREMTAMKSVSHRGLLRIIDADDDAQWFVSEYHPNGVLVDHLGRFKGDLASSLRAIRPVVAGVAELHKMKMVHRDIKPHNIFVSGGGELVLGDFGLVFFADDKHERLSATLENVGTRDWMPQWATGMRVDQIKPSFDVFSLGKVLWSILSGKPLLRLWYFKRAEFNVEALFPESSGMTLANRLFNRCIVENEEDCLDDAGLLLGEIDRLLAAVDRGGDVLGGLVARPCRVCGFGTYEMVVDRNSAALHNVVGITATGCERFACSFATTAETCSSLRLMGTTFRKPGRRDGGG